MKVEGYVSLSTITVTTHPLEKYLKNATEVTESKLIEILNNEPKYESQISDLVEKYLKIKIPYHDDLYLWFIFKEKKKHLSIHTFKNCSILILTVRNYKQGLYYWLECKVDNEEVRGFLIISSINQSEIYCHLSCKISFRRSVSSLSKIL